jgi:hypothetical protein
MRLSRTTFADRISACEREHRVIAISVIPVFGFLNSRFPPPTAIRENLHLIPAGSAPDGTYSAAGMRFHGGILVSALT